MEKKLSLVERTILANQYRILAQTGGDDTNITKAEILEGGFTGHYHQALLHDEEISAEICEETNQILNMYRAINAAYTQLTPEEKDGLNIDHIRFDGFDANGEGHYHYASFMIEDLDLWQEHAELYLNSHTSFSLVKYRKLLEIFDGVYGKPNYDLSRDVLQQMVDAV